MHRQYSIAVLATGCRALTGAIGVASGNVSVCEQASSVIALVTEPAFLDTQSHVGTVDVATIVLWNEIHREGVSGEVGERCEHDES